MAGVVGGQQAAGNGRLLLVALAAFALGLVIYLFDRDPARSSLIPAVAAMADTPLFGAAANWLPSFLHPFAFSLFTAAACAPRSRPRYEVCAVWWSVNIVFEIAQAPSISQAFAEGADQFFGPMWVTRTLSNYLLTGTFDHADVLAATAGALAAGAVLHLMRPREATDAG